MAEVEDILANYELINEDEFDAATIHPGSVVKVHCDELNMDVEYKIVGSQEADPMHGRISEESPFGRALMGQARRCHRRGGSARRSDPLHRSKHFLRHP